MDFRLAPLVSELVTMRGRRVEVFDVGTSRGDDPVVFLLTGAGDTARSWLPVQTELSHDFRVISYERSGVGASEPGSARTLAGFLAELDGVIETLAPGRPVVLVGHSLGALVARVYAARHPQRTAGLVLLDATPERLNDDTVRRLGYRFYVEGIALLRAALPRAAFAWLVRTNLLPYYPGRTPFLEMLDDRARKEWDSAVRNLLLGDAVAEMRAVLPSATEASLELGMQHPLGDVPVAMLTSGTYGRGWTAMHDAIARRYPRATHELSGDRFHNVHMRHVSRVVGMVHDVVARGRDHID
jgi:pimeloyl-ACP methyl ester carboxylesterase